ncbi:MAG: hypothetical protein ACLP1X_18595 [Polyangiaceae bacterium]
MKQIAAHPFPRKALTPEELLDARAASAEFAKMRRQGRLTLAAITGKNAARVQARIDRRKFGPAPRRSCARAPRRAAPRAVARPTMCVDSDDGPPPPLLLSARTAGLTARQLRALVAKHGLCAVRIGRSLHVRRDVLLRALGLADPDQSAPEVPAWNVETARLRLLRGGRRS